MLDVILESVLTCPQSGPLKTRGHANRRLSVLLGMRELQDHPAPEVGRLLRVLFIRDGEVPADAVAWLLWVDPKKGRRTPKYVG